MKPGLSARTRGTHFIGWVLIPASLMLIFAELTGVRGNWIKDGILSSLFLALFGGYLLNQAPRPRLARLLLFAAFATAIAGMILSVSG